MVVEKCQNTYNKLYKMLPSALNIFYYLLQNYLMKRNYVMMLTNELMGANKLLIIKTTCDDCWWSDDKFAPKCALGWLKIFFALNFRLKMIWILWIFISKYGNFWASISLKKFYNIAYSHVDFIIPNFPSSAYSQFISFLRLSCCSRNNFL